MARARRLAGGAGVVIAALVSGLSAAPLSQQLSRTDADSLQRKLTAIMAPANTYIFTSRTGLKVLEKSTGQLALAFKRGTLHSLDDAPLFERALAAVLNKLRQLNRGK